MSRDVEELFRHEQRDESHHLQVGLERFEFFPDLGLAIIVGLMDRKLGRQRRLFQRVGFRAGLFRRHIDGDDIVAALEQRFQHGLAERLLPVNHDTHIEKPLS